MSTRTSDAERRALNRLKAGAAEYACGGFLNRTDTLHRTDIYTSLLYDRLQRKYNTVNEIYSSSGENWNQTLYVMLFRTLGDLGNREQYMAIAQRVPYKAVLRERGESLNIEAMLFGTSGLLYNYHDDEYTLNLKRNFEYLSRKYNITPLNPCDWNITRINPMNHPILRLAQLSAFLAQNNFVFDRMVDCRTEADVFALFGVEASTYWSSHFIPSQSSCEQPKRVGRSKSNILAINLVAILQYAYGIYTQSEALRERALTLLDVIPAEDNRYIRRWRNYGLQPKSAFETQALLQLATEYCDKTRCEECAVGRRAMQNFGWIDAL